MSQQKAVIQHSTDTEFETPDDFFDESCNKLNIFPQLDICATLQNTKCKKFYTKEQDAFNFEWNEDLWANIPFGSKVNKEGGKKPINKGLVAWVQRIHDQHKKHNISAIVLLPLSASIVAKFCNSAEFYPIPKRITFLKNGAPDRFPISKDLMLLVFRSKQNVIDTFFSGFDFKIELSLRGGIFD